MNNIYIGNRYVPTFADPIEWDNLRTYEALTIVTYNGTSYTSKKSVPTGIDLNNNEYWVATGNYNAQVQDFINKVNDLSGETEKNKNELDNRSKSEWCKGKSLYFCGDSNLATTGTSDDVKISEVIQEMLPDTTIIDLNPNTGAMWTTIGSQLSQVPETADAVFIWCGGNDIGACVNGNLNIGSIEPNNFDSSSFDTNTSLGAMNKLLCDFKKTHTKTKIVGLIRTLKQKNLQNVEIQKTIYSQIIRVYKKYNCEIINMNDYSSLSNNIENQMNVYSIDGGTHFNAKCKRELLAPVIVSVIKNACCSNTQPFGNYYTFDGNTVPTNAEAVEILSKNLEPYNAPENVVSKQGTAYCSGIYSNISNTLMRFRVSGDTELYNGGVNRHIIGVSKGTDLTLPINVETLPYDIDLCFDSNERSQVSGLPTDLTGGFYLSYRINATGAKFYFAVAFNGSAYYGLSAPTGTITWHKLTSTYVS